MTRTLEDLKIQMQVAEELTCGINVEMIIDTFEELIMHDDYLPEVYREHFRKPEVLESNAMFVMANIMAFSAMVALRRVHRMTLPENLTREEVVAIMTDETSATLGGVVQEVPPIRDYY